MRQDAARVELPTARRPCERLTGAALSGLLAGVGLEFYAISASLEAWESIYSSRDQALFDTIVRSEDRAIRGYLKIQGPLPEKAASVPRNLVPLHDIFIGAACDRRQPHEYAYALIACAFAIGERVGESGGSHGRLMRARGEIERLGERGDIVPDYGCDWPLPGRVVTGGGPYNWVTRNADLKAQADDLRGLLARRATALDDPEMYSVKSTLEDCLSFYDEAIARGRDLIVVCH